MAMSYSNDQSNGSVFNSCSIIWITGITCPPESTLFEPARTVKCMAACPLLKKFMLVSY